MLVTNHFKQRLNWWYRAWRYRMHVERPGIQFVLQNLRPGDVAIDAGAHKGAFLYWMQRAVGPEGKVIAFEPQPELARYLTDVVSASRLPHVRIVNAALSQRPGIMTLKRESTQPSPGARLSAGAEAPVGQLDGQMSFEVRVEALDQALTSADRPIRLIKCDVEGHELEVFRGAKRILEQDRPLLLFECERRHHGGRSITPVFDFLERIGYTGMYLDRQRTHSLASFRPEWQDNPKSPQYVNNFAFLPRRQAA